MTTSKQPTILGYATIKSMAALCLANADDADRACAWAREHLPATGDFERLVDAIRRQAAEQQAAEAQ
jgi:hypothetical protein